MIPSKPVSTPVLGLRMRSTSSCYGPMAAVPPPPPPPQSAANLRDSIQAMLVQDGSTTYTCEDKYVRRHHFQGNHNNNNSSSSCDNSTAAVVSTDSVVDSSMDNTVDTVCREKMVEWMYRVADHFGEDREVVAMSQSTLDRFVALCCCDRSAFKLAAMTSLFLSAKTNGATTCSPTSRLTIGALSELSRGEFNVQHIAEMEMILLQTLGWRVNPPTAQSFIHAFYHYLPVAPQGPISMAIYQRALFFAELAVYDHSLATKERSLLAMAAMLNAMEGMDEASVPAQQQDCFLDAVSYTVGLTFSRDVVEDCRNRLWFVYSCSAQYRDEDPSASSSSSSSSTRNKNAQAELVKTPVRQHAEDPSSNMHGYTGISSSPVSVVSPMRR